MDTPQHARFEVAEGEPRRPHVNGETVEHSERLVVAEPGSVPAILGMISQSVSARLPRLDEHLAANS